MKYFDFLLTFIKTSTMTKYTKLLSYLFDRPFQYRYPMDENRKEDGLYLRNSYSTREVERLSYEHIEFISHYALRDCSWLEVMIALAVRCEDIMCKPGPNTTPRWFWGMIDSLYLSDQINDKFDIETVERTMQALENYEYQNNGFGGLFHVPDLDTSVYDMRKMDLYTQAMRYLEQFD